MRYVLSAIFGVFATLALSIPLQQLIRLKDLEAYSLQARKSVGGAMLSVNVDVPPLKEASTDRREPRIKFIPQYPSEAAAKKLEGFVSMSYKVAPDGTVHDIKVLESQPPTVFDKAAKRAVARWNYGIANSADQRLVQDEQRLRLVFNLRKTLASE